MSATTASLRRKITSAGDLQSVVRTMKALAASSIGQYERSVRSLEEYARTVELGLGVCFRENPADVLAAESAEPGPLGAVVFGSDQGLVGSFNDVIADHALAALAGSPGARIWAVGERVQIRLADAGWATEEILAVPESVRSIAPLVGRILMQTEEIRSRGGIGELHLFYNSPGAGASYRPVSRRLLPLDESWRREIVGHPWPGHSLPGVVGSVANTLRALVREHLFVSLFRACAESLTSENASRLAAMERAEQNIDELLEELQSSYHRQRQSSIDEELFDVIAGYELLGKKR